MAKRGGELDVSWDSPERKRLRNSEALAHAPVAPSVSEEQSCADAISGLLQQSHTTPLHQRMDAAVQLVQKLKRLQELETQTADALFDQLYSGVLDYFGDVVRQLQKTKDDGDADSVQRSFAGIYQYLVEIIAKHTECIIAASTGIGASLVALVLLKDCYSDAHIWWMSSLYSRCLSKESGLPLRIVAWALLPIYCHHMSHTGKDGYEALGDVTRVSVDDPPQLIEVVANVVCFVACARTGHLHVRFPPRTPGLDLDDMEDDDVDDQQDTKAQCESLFCLLRDAVSGDVDTLAIHSIYACAECDGYMASAATSAPVGRSVTMSDWVPYWFIAGNPQYEDASVYFMRNAARFVVHAQVEDVGLKQSPLGQATIRRLTSSNREIRLAAKDAVLSYTKSRSSDSEQRTQIIKSNRMEAARTLLKLEQEVPKPRIFRETFLLVAGGIGCTSPITDEAMCEVLPYLVSYYCQSNVFLHAVAMEQLLLVAQAHRVSLSQLLTCYSESIACALASILSREPNATFLTCMEMLSTTAAQFLRRHEERVVTHLFTTGNEEALGTVAQILAVQLPVLCVDHAASVFAQIFLMDDQLMPQAIKRFVSLLSTDSEMNRDQVEVNIPSLLRSCLVKLVFKLVVALGERDSKLRRRARSALATVQGIVDGAAPVATSDGSDSQGVSKLVRQTATNMSISSGDSPRSGGRVSSMPVNNEVAQFLSRNILGVLAYMNEMLRDSDLAAASDLAARTAVVQDEQRRRKAIRAIGELSVLLGSRAALHMSNLVSLLTLPLDNESLAPFALQSWIILAEVLAQVRLSADQINALVVPLLATFFSWPAARRDQTAAAINKVVELHKKGIRQHHLRICPIPDETLLSKSNLAIREFGLHASLRQRLDGLVELLDTRDATVVLCASREIHALVEQHTAQISAWKQAFHPGDATSSPILAGGSRSHGRGGNAQANAAFVAQLLGTLRTASGADGGLGEMAAASCAACIAAVGAVDSRALSKNNLEPYPDLREQAGQGMVHGLCDIDGGEEDERVEFICTLIVDHLSQAFALAPSPSVQMGTAYSIQELLRLAGFTAVLLGPGAEESQPVISAKGKKGASRKQAASGMTKTAQLRQRWELLPPNVTEIVRPLLSSKYTIQSSNRSTGASEDGIARVPCIKRVGSYVGWLRLWIYELTSALPTTTPAGRLFRACLSTIREGDVDLLMFILYRLAYQYCLQRHDPARKTAEPILVDDDDDGDTEMTLDGKQGRLELQTAGATENGDILADELLAVLTSDAAAWPGPNDQLLRCHVAGLELMDAFSGHVRAQQASREANKRNSRRDSRASNTTAEEEALLKIVHMIPHRVAARAAAACGQYERAIMQTELAMRESAPGNRPMLFGNVDDADIAQIQELCYSLDDVDGVAGTVLCRKQADVKLSIQRHEIEGNWSYALIGHESQLRQRPDSKESQLGWIRCMQNMGQWEGSWAAAKSLFGDESVGEAEQQLTSACHAAAWRLGKWAWIQQTDSLATAPQTLGFDASNSSLLLQISCTGSGSKSLKDALDAAFRVVGRDIAKAAVSLRHTVPGQIHMATSARDMTQEIHAHMLGDIGLLSKHLGDAEELGAHNCNVYSGALNSLVEQWHTRVGCLPPIYPLQEPVLALHARLYELMLARIPGADASGSRCGCAATIVRQAMRTRLQAAQLARLAGHRATALGILTYAEAASQNVAPSLLAPLRTEHAQILWSEGHTADAITTVSRVTESLSEWLNIANDVDETASGTTSPAPSGALDGHGQKPDHGEANETKSEYARALLLLLQWQEQANSVSSTLLLRQYEKIVRVQESDRVHYALGHLYDSLFTMSEKDSGSRSSKTAQDHRDLQLATLQYYIVRHYSRTVVYSSRFLYRALPRLLTVWLDFGASILRPAEAKNTRMVDRFRTANRVVINLAKRLPAYDFLVVLSQLVSRLSHPNEEVLGALESIVLRVLELFPQQTLWQLMGVQRSTYAVRAERCNAILAKARAAQSNEPIASGRGSGGRAPGMSELIQQATKLTDLLLALCNAPTPGRTASPMHMSRDFNVLARSTPLDLIVPLQRSLVPSLPDTFGGAEHELALSGVQIQTGSSAQTASQRGMLHQPFGADLPTISAFDDIVEVMHSLQRPKKITAVGSDGRRYSFLCKPKDDLRKDARLMEFNSMINQLLSGDAQAQKRGLAIRTYAVVALNEECGLIEWVPATTGIRHVLLRLYKERGVATSMQQVKQILDSNPPSPEDAFVRQLLPLFPPVLHAWFARSFPAPSAWLAARANFTRSAAVMSMVGHIVGLGDRHCENILLDEGSGAVVHVDFNCLFEKGMTLEKPERVPFRLTHNMVDAMGVTGYEGAFRRTCELTLGLLREHRDALMSVLEAFLHDPLVEWSRRATRAASRSSKDPTRAQPNEQAARCLANIRKKLQGSIQGITALSVDGQVDTLITEATDPKRLFAMYIGWAAFM
ncbi:hypothetical protein GGF46_001235 [Coemansia sp. RSA 552]|nr:hypothetical protein GGF46_001235 [Coemansia sp. RSA 552]